MYARAGTDVVKCGIHSGSNSCVIQRISVAAYGILSGARTYHHHYHHHHLHKNHTHPHGEALHRPRGDANYPRVALELGAMESRRRGNPVCQCEVLSVHCILVTSHATQILTSSGDLSPVTEVKSH